MGQWTKGRKPTLKRVRFELGDDCYTYLRELSCQELLKYQETMGKDDSESASFLYDVLSKCICTEDGAPIFSDVDDCKAGLDLGLSAMIAMQKKVFEVSGIVEPPK